MHLPFAQAGGYVAWKVHRLQLGHFGRLSTVPRSRYRRAVKSLRRSQRPRQQAPPPTPTPLPDDFRDADIELWARVEPFTMTTPGRVEVLARTVEYLVARPVLGAFVECGVWRGGSMMAAALTLQRLGVDDRELYLFDTFAGMPPPGEHDVKQGGRHASELADGPADLLGSIATLDEVRRNMLSLGYPDTRIHFVEGQVEETLPAAAPEQIALLRLDTDWYSSTKHELNHLFPRLVPGGVLIVDDYAYWRGARKAVDEYIREHDLALLLTRVDHGARVAVKV